jgi:superfamily II DNA or RNA helicase
VRCRNREWVLLPSPDDNVYRLRPLAGSEDDAVLVHKKIAQILGFDLPEERVTPARFPPPTADPVGDAISSKLLWEAARLTLRDGAAPFRSLGRMSIRPRVYQLVPLLMALRLDPVRLFIADDVGVGKTIEALLIARELWDRGEIRRLAVLCPPYLCEQWEAELATKSNLQPVIIRSGTISMLERRLPPGKSVYQHYPVQVISIDWVKSERNKKHFLQFCPDLVIADEVHGAAAGNTSGQQERYSLLRDIASKKDQHLILLTATPHSGKPEAFKSLLGLLDERFKEWDVANLDEEKRTVLARHFVQRTRRDIQESWEKESVFPERQSQDATYKLSPQYAQLFEQTFQLCQALVDSAKQLDENKQQAHHWAALGLLRCVMSSPAAALSALQSRLNDHEKGESPAAEDDHSGHVWEATDQAPEDETPSLALEVAAQAFPDRYRKKLQELAQLASTIQEQGYDTKLETCAGVLRTLVAEGFSPIVWCRYVATAEYVGKELEKRTPSWGLGEVQVLVVTGRMGDEERRAKIAELKPDRPRILIATDCLSEGINLQELFSAVLHYDLPWNPNRLEQREGRADRYGQAAKIVKAVRFYGIDNPVDGAVLRVLIQKADEIRKSLGTHVPIPEESETLMQAILADLFSRFRKPEQLCLFEDERVLKFHEIWDRLHGQERANRTRFAQRAIKPEEVRKELEATDQVLGDPKAVQRFVLDACQRLGLSFRPDRKNPHVYHLLLDESALQNLPPAVRAVLPTPKRAGKEPLTWPVTFISPSPPGAEYLGRNHRFVATLASSLLETALGAGAGVSPHGLPLVARCGAIRTQAVHRLTTLLLLRARYLLTLPPKPQGGGQENSLLAEEVLVAGFSHEGARGLGWLPPEEALRLFAQAQPTENIPSAEKRDLVEAELQLLGLSGENRAKSDAAALVERQLHEFLRTRAQALEESHKNLRRAVGERLRGLKLEPLAQDVLGILVLQPEVRL